MLTRDGTRTGVRRVIVVVAVAALATTTTGCATNSFVSGFAAGIGNATGNMIIDMISLGILTRIAENAIDDLGAQLANTFEPLLPEKEPDGGEQR